MPSIGIRTCTLASLSVLIGVAIGVTTDKAAAQTVSAVAACNQREDSDLALRGCTALIEHDGLDRSNLAIAYFKRSGASEARFSRLA